jgi:hypothetical protein
MKISTIIKQLENKGFNKRQIADQLHTSPSSIGKWLADIHPPSKANLDVLTRFHDLVVVKNINVGLKRLDELTLNDLGELAKWQGYQATFTKIIN